MSKSKAITVQVERVSLKDLEWVIEGLKYRGMPASRSAAVRWALREIAGREFREAQLRRGRA